MQKMAKSAKPKILTPSSFRYRILGNAKSKIHYYCKYECYLFTMTVFNYNYKKCKI